MAANRHAENFTLEPMTLQCRVIHQFRCSLVCRIHFWCYFFSIFSFKRYLHKSKMAANRSAENFTLEPMNLQCRVIHQFRCSLVCRIRFWCYLFSIFSFKLYLHKSKMAAKRSAENFTLQPITVQCRVIALHQFRCSLIFIIHLRSYFLSF